MDEKNQRITVKCEARAEIEEKKSIFIASIAPVNSEDDARSFIDRIRREYYDARHNVYAYVVEGGAIARFTDDGEPKGSSGIPVLNVLKMSGVDGVCVVVTRYFGGILLGTGGLARAYSSAAKAALDKAGLSVMAEYSICEITCTYSDYTKLSAKFPSVNAVEEGSEFGADVKIVVSCLTSDSSALSDLVTQTTAGRSSLKTVRLEERVKR